jgi:hypothetical protein
MSFHVTPVRRFYVVLACGFFVLALVSGVFPFVDETVPKGRINAFVLAGLFVLMGIFNLWRARRTSPSDNVTHILVTPDLASVPEQTRHFRLMFWLSIVAFPAMTVSIAYELHRLESGAAERVLIWAPISAVYEHFGYWPAVLSLPVLGLIGCIVSIHKLRKLESR